MTKTLNELIQEAMVKMTKTEEMHNDDVQNLASAIKKIESIRDEELKPYLIVWNLNVWNPIREFIEDALELIGYEDVGNMDMSDDEYKFESEEIYHEILFRHREKNCDYTNTLRLKS